MFCNSKIEVMKVKKIIELTPCQIEIHIETNLICDFPVFNNYIQLAVNKNNIDCYPMIKNDYPDEIKDIKFNFDSSIYSREVFNFLKH